MEKLFHENEIDCQYEAGEGSQMVPMQGLVFKAYHREDCEDDERKHLLDNFELDQRKGAAVTHEPRTVGRNLTTVLGKGKQPGNQYDEYQRCLVREDAKLLQFQMAIPGYRHENIRYNE